VFTSFFQKGKVLSQRHQKKKLDVLIYFLCFKYLEKNENKLKKILTLKNKLKNLVLSLLLIFRIR